MNRIPFRLDLWIIATCLFYIEHFTGRKIFLRIFGKIENWLIKNIDNDLQKKPRKSDFRILEYNEFGQNFNELISDRSPVIFRGAAKDWECCKQWNLDYFEEEFGDYIVTIQDNVGLVDKDVQQHFTKMSMKDYISAVKSGSKKYLKFARTIRDEKILNYFLDVKWIKQFSKSRTFNNNFYFFIGGSDTRTPIHNGFPATVFIQAYGKKKWTFYAPEDMFFLGIRPERRSYFYSNVNINKVDEVEYPLMKYARKHEVILNEGDVLWFSPFIIHQVENLTDSIGVAYKSVDFSRSLFSSKIMTTLFFLATKPDIFTLLIGNRTNDNDYIFSKDKKDLKT